MMDTTEDDSSSSNSIPTDPADLDQHTSPTKRIAEYKGKSSKDDAEYMEGEWNVLGKSGNELKDDSDSSDVDLLSFISLQRREKESKSHDPGFPDWKLDLDPSYVLTYSRHTLPIEGISGIEKKSSSDELEYIKGKWENGRLIEVHSCQFIFQDDANRTVHTRVNGKDNLFTCDADNFVARVKISLVEEVWFTEESFAIVKSNFFQNLRIIKILEDRKLEERNTFYDKFGRCLRDRGFRTADNLGCASDFLQLSLLLEKHKNLMGSSRSSASIALILNLILDNKYMSTEVKDVAERLANAERAMQERNKHFPKIDNIALSYAWYLCEELQKIHDEGVDRHKKALLTECPTYYSGLPEMKTDLNKLTGKQALYFSSKDIQLLRGLDATTNGEPEYTMDGQYDPLVREFLKDLWCVLYGKVINKNEHRSLGDLAPLTNPTYLHLHKSFHELIIQIARSGIPAENLLIREEEEWIMEDIIFLPSTCNISRSVLQQFRFIFKLMEHFQPGYDSDRKKFKYDFKVKHFSFDAKKLSAIPEERLIWLYVLDDAIAKMQRGKASEEAKERSKLLLDPLLAGCINCIEQCNDRYESLRITVSNIINFVAQVTSKVDSESKFDRSISEKQIQFIREMMVAQLSDDKVTEYFASLIDVFDEFWKHRKSIIASVCQMFPYEQFQSQMEEISQKSLGIVDNMLDKKGNPDTMVNFFRSFNEFLKHLESHEFEWLIKDDGFSLELISEGSVELIDEDKKSYRVLEPEEFISFCDENEISVPRHYPIEIVNDLLETVNEYLGGQESRQQDDDTCLNETSDLLLVIRHSFIHFKDQSTYVDFNVFLEDSTKPFRNVVKGNSSYQEFKKRLDNIENFYLYTRKQNEINIEKALDLYATEAEMVQSSGFDSSFDRSILSECYERYSNDFNGYIEKANEGDIIAGLSEVQGRLKLENNLQIDKWTFEFKRETLPSLLAGLAAVWSIQRSKDVAITGKYLKPHCIQILCILKLLGVDQRSNLENQLAQVLTGQGKSIVLGLLSALLSLVGYRVRVVCYSRYLAKRDQQDFDDFFQKFDQLGIKENVTYGTFEDMANAIIGPEDRKDLRSLVSNLVFDNLGKQTDRPVDSLNHSLNILGGNKQDNTDLIKEDNAGVIKEDNTILLIDEVDVFFSDKFYGNTYNPLAMVKMEALADIQLKIWLMVADGTRMGNVLKIINDHIDKIIRDNEDEKFIKFLLTNGGSFFKEHLVAMIDSAIKVKESSLENRYKINSYGVISCKDSDGFYSTWHFYGYDNVFNYFRLKKTNYNHKNYRNYGYLMLNCGVVSYAKLPNEYPVILGVSGTLTNLNNSEKRAIRSYDVNKVSIMPSFFGRHKLKYDENEDFAVVDSEEVWLNTIFKSTNSKIQSGRSVLIFFHTENELNKFKGKFQSDIDRMNTLTGNEEKSCLDWCINESGVSKTVTLAIRAMGRGIDFKSNDSSVEEKGGVHVIQTFFSLDEKEEVQIKGRTARKDNKGSYELILCRKHLEHLNESGGDPIDSYKNLNSIRKTLAETRGEDDAKKIKKSELKHNLTIKFFNSLSDYTPDKRSKLFSEYPFVDTNAME